MGSATLYGIFRRIGKERGRNSEDRFFEVFSCGRIPPNFPPWFSGVQRPTNEQDRRRRIDVIAFTKDVGKIYLQLKSSKSGVKKFEEQQRRNPKPEWVFPLIIRPTDSNDEVEIKTRRVLSQARQTILNHRSRSN